MAASIYDWSGTAASNSNVDSDIAWPEGQAPSTVNNSARAMMQRVQELLEDIGGSLSASGTADGLIVTAGSAYSALADGRIISFRATADNTGAATLNVNGIGAKAIRKMAPSGDVALGAGDIQSTGIYVAQYSAALNAAAGAWLLVNPTPANVTATTVTADAFVGTSGANDDAILASGTAGSIFLRPEGAASTTNQTSIDTNGNMIVDGSIQFVEIDNSGSTSIKVGGALTYIFHSSQFHPNPDNFVHLGFTTNRWASVWSVIGTIQTSDARDKTPLRPMSAAELNASKEIGRSIGFYRWLKDEGKKGEFCGVTVQAVAAIMKKHDLKPFEYGFIRYEEDRYSLIYSDLMMFLARGFEQRLSELEG